jgi:hypothetical protein
MGSCLTVVVSVVLSLDKPGMSVDAVRIRRLEQERLSQVEIRASAGQAKYALR